MSGFRCIAPLLAAWMTLSVASEVGAQCGVTGPTEVCPGSTITLCGPSGQYYYEWSGPGVSSSAQCVDISEPGTYYLWTYDFLTGAQNYCGTTVTQATAPVCSITGPVEACEGEAVELCGPEGEYVYSWSGPGGFTADMRCVSVSQTGTYQLTLSKGATCSVTSTCSQDVTFQSCGGTTEAMNCPRRPEWWAKQLRRAERTRGGMGHRDLEEVAACVDASSECLSWSHGLADFEAALRSRSSVRARAKRHFAAVWANVCAADDGLSMAALSRETNVTLPAVSTTVGAWLDDTESQLRVLEGRSLSSLAVRRAYREIVRVGWCINHGFGIGPVCDASSVEPESASEPSLEEEMAEDGAELSVRSPGAFSTNAAEVAFSVIDDQPRDVVVSVYDVAGRHLADLARGQYAPGDHLVRWDGRESGRPVGSGVYFIRAKIGDLMASGRIALVR